MDLFAPDAAPLRYKGAEKYSTLGTKIYTAVAAVLLLIVFSVSVAERNQEIPTDAVVTEHRARSLDDLIANSFTVGGNEFNIAFGYSDRHDSPDVVEDPIYGTLEALIATRLPDGTFAYETIPTHPCTNQDFDSKFPPANDLTASEIEFH